jgi:hypothetical protein
MNFSASGQDFRFAFREIAIPPRHVIVGKGTQGIAGLMRVIAASSDENQREPHA